ncbi:hypothetical protein MDA_GLEAN10007257 [Myotis davidii]|uniref:Uncharacterized protein n=1 Tax=Myotis davidii TaxID=225400 RepID=L5MHA5_MYODS|nr:hypothetical protein MDA_GLEAN10007257 [Myotis davidii]
MDLHRKSLVLCGCIGRWAPGMLKSPVGLAPTFPVCSHHTGAKEETVSFLPLLSSGSLSTAAPADCSQKLTASVIRKGAAGETARGASDSHLHPQRGMQRLLRGCDGPCEAVTAPAML